MINPELIKPLAKKEIDFSQWCHTVRQKEKIPVFERVLFFDPAPLYEAVQHKIKPTKRHQGLAMEDIFPKKPTPECACGCGTSTKSGQNKGGASWNRKWATDACESFASDVLSIMNNYFGKPAFYIDLYHGHVCCECPETNLLELDHVVGVKHGGGACWLSNYVWRCKACHNKKTNKDFAKGEFKAPNQMKLIP